MLLDPDEQRRRAIASIRSLPDDELAHAFLEAARSRSEWERYPDGDESNSVYAAGVAVHHASQPAVVYVLALTRRGVPTAQPRPAPAEALEIGPCTHCSTLLVSRAKGCTCPVCLREIELSATLDMESIDSVYSPDPGVSSMSEDSITYLSSLTDDELARLLLEATEERSGRRQSKSGGEPWRRVYVATVTDYTKGSPPMTFVLGAGTPRFLTTMVGELIRSATQWGSCECCNTLILSVSKVAICPVCQSQAYLT